MRQLNAPKAHDFSLAVECDKRGALGGVEGEASMTPLPSVTYGWSRNTVAVPGGGGSLVGGGGGSVETDPLIIETAKKNQGKKTPGVRASKSLARL